MQTIYDLTSEQIAELADDAINMFVDIACAQKGAPLLPPEPREPEKPAAQPDQVFFGVAGIYFEQAEQAADVLATITKYKTYEYSYKDFGKIAKPGRLYNADQVSSEKMFSVGYYDQHRKTLEKYEAEKKTYDADKKRYDQAVKDRQSITSEIWDMVSIAREIKSEREQIQRTYNRYLEIAKGDQRIAFDFLKSSLGNQNYEHNHSVFITRFEPMPQSIDEAA